MEHSEIEKEILAEKKSISHMRTFLLIFLVSVISCFSVFYYTAQQHAGRQMVDATVFDTRLQNLENSIPIHEKHLAKLEEDILKLSKSQVTTTSIHGDDVNERLGLIEKEIKSLKSPEASNKQDSGQISQAITLLSVFHRLSSNITTGKPFIAELSSFQEKFGADDDKSLNDLIASLMPYADNGIPTTNKLVSSFDDAIDTMKHNEIALPDTSSFWEKLRFNISHMVTVRKISKAQKGSSINAIIGRAQDHLDNEEIEAAISEVKSLPDNVRNNFSTWLEDAQMASMAPSIVDQIEEKVMKKAFSAQQNN